MILNNQSSVLDFGQLLINKLQTIKICCCPSFPSILTRRLPLHRTLLLQSRTHVGHFSHHRMYSSFSLSFLSNLSAMEELMKVTVKDAALNACTQFQLRSSPLLLDSIADMPSLTTIHLGKGCLTKASCVLTSRSDRSSVKFRLSSNHVDSFP